MFDVLTGVSVKGGIEAAWPGLHVTARTTIDALAGHWGAHGLPAYGQFDNDSRFAGVHGYADRLGHVVRFCLSVGVVPVFAPRPREAFPERDQATTRAGKAKVWRRFFFPAFVVSWPRPTGTWPPAGPAWLPRIEAAPEPATDRGPAVAAPASTIVYLRRTDGEGATRLGPGHQG